MLHFTFTDITIHTPTINTGSDVLLDGVTTCQVVNWYHTDNGGKYLVRVDPKCSLWVEASRVQLKQ